MVEIASIRDRKSTRLNSSHLGISYAVFCLKKKTEVRTALEQSRCLMLVWAPRSPQSGQVNEAVRYFKQLGRFPHIFPIVIAFFLNARAPTSPYLFPQRSVPPL